MFQEFPRGRGICNITSNFANMSPPSGQEDDIVCAKTFCERLLVFKRNVYCNIFSHTSLVVFKGFFRGPF